MAEKGTSQPRQAKRVKDARGRSVTMLDPYVLHLTRQHSVIPAEPLAKIAHEVRSGIEHFPRWVVRVCAIAWGLAVVVYVIYCVDLLRRGRLSDLFGAPGIMMSSLCFLPALLWYGAKRLRFARICKAMLQHLRCPYCGYDIRSLPTDPEDGATVCPECGCAWKLNDAEVVGKDRRGVSSVPRKHRRNDIPAQRKD
jgi:hypothetical protein